MSHFSEKHEAEGLAMHTPEYERQIAETMAEREAPAWKVKLTQENARRRAERREAIARDVLIALIHESSDEDQLRFAPKTAVAVACGLLDALDSAWLRDREATR